jgi:hypothetical protein
MTAAKHMTMIPFKESLSSRLRQDGIRTYDDIAPYNELFRAFMAAGYSQVTMEYPYTVIQYFYSARADLTVRIAEDARHNLILQLADLQALLYSNTMMMMPSIQRRVGEFLQTEHVDEFTFRQLPEYEEIVDALMINEIPESTSYVMEKNHYRNLHDSFEIPSPKIVFISDVIVHEPYDRIYPEGSLENPYDVSLHYMPQHNHAAAVMLNLIDMILEQTPDAVIVIQGDHGILGMAQIHMMNEGYPEEMIFDLYHSVISAIRVPEHLATIDEPIAPLNLTRFLVNTFVGQNYEYLE